jgi:hypothetical protein
LVKSQVSTPHLCMHKSLTVKHQEVLPPRISTCVALQRRSIQHSRRSSSQKQVSTTTLTRPLATLVGDPDVGDHSKQSHRDNSITAATRPCRRDSVKRGKQCFEPEANGIRPMCLKWRLTSIAPDRLLKKPSCPPRFAFKRDLSKVWQPKPQPQQTGRDRASKTILSGRNFGGLIAKCAEFDMQAPLSPRQTRCVHPKSRSASPATKRVFALKR